MSKCTWEVLENKNKKEFEAVNEHNLYFGKEFVILKTKTRLGLIMELKLQV